MCTNFYCWCQWSVKNYDSIPVLIVTHLRKRIFIVTSQLDWSFTSVQTLCRKYVYCSFRMNTVSAWIYNTQYFNLNLGFFSIAQPHHFGQDLPIIEASQSHSDTSHSVGLLWTSDHPDAQNYSWQHTTLTRDRHSWPRWDSNPQSQQASGRRPTPWTARPLGSTICIKFPYFFIFFCFYSAADHGCNGWVSKFWDFFSLLGRLINFCTIMYTSGGIRRLWFAGQHYPL
jgi:hypothetical protein